MNCFIPYPQKFQNNDSQNNAMISKARAIRGITIKHETHKKHHIDPKLFKT